MGLLHVNNVTNFNSALLNLTFHMSDSAYHGNFTYGGQMVFKSEVVDIYKPVFYVYEYNNSRFVSIRGSQDVDDYTTDLNYFQIDTKYGSFHQGFYKSATYVVDLIRPYFKNYTGPVYFTGHSYGAAVATICAVILLQDIPNGDFNAIVLGPPPCFDYRNFGYIGKIATFVNDGDSVVTLSVANAWAAIRHLFKSDDRVLEPKEVENALMDMIKPLADWSQYVDLVKTLIKLVTVGIPDIIKCALGRLYPIRYPCGCVYIISQETQRSIESLQVSVEDKFSMVELSIDGINAHSRTEYIKSLEYVKVF